MHLRYLLSSFLGTKLLSITCLSLQFSSGIICFSLCSPDNLFSIFHLILQSLFPLRVNRDKKHPRTLGESLGIEFPDLSMLNGYLNHWGNHKVTGNKTLYSWINDDGAVVARRTYGELEANTACIAHKLMTS